MASLVQEAHCSHCDKNNGVALGFFWVITKTQLKTSTPFDHLLNNLIDCIAIFSLSILQHFVAIHPGSYSEMRQRWDCVYGSHHLRKVSSGHCRRCSGNRVHNGVAALIMRAVFSGFWRENPPFDDFFDCFLVLDRFHDRVDSLEFLNGGPVLVSGFPSGTRT